MLNRRSIMSALAGTPFALRSIDAKALIAQGLGAASVGASAAKECYNNTSPIGLSHPPVHPLKQLLGIDPWEIRNALQNEQQTRFHLRQCKFCDPDLEAIRSYSSSFRARKQLERNLGEAELERAWNRACERW